MQTELLAPAKDYETAIVAINSGADAIYIGASDFGARHNATNSLENIKELVEYAHKFYVRIYVTVNTIIKDEELKKVRKLICDLYDIGVDGLIIQDMAILKMAIDKQIPPIPLHISTQCDNRTLEKVKFFEKLGLPRVVLARELSLEQIKNIKDNTNIELECFCHGALCVSYSGQCYLSQSIGGRSANRGECAQPCRKKYSLIDDKGNVLVKDKHLLSLKDFKTSKHIKKMIDIGVTSFKIEGRLKDKNYVKNVTLFYRQLLDKYSEKTSSGQTITDFQPNIYKTFNRDFTDYFLEKRKDCFNFDTNKFRGEYIGKIKGVNREKGYFIVEPIVGLHKQDGLCFGEDAKLGCLINKIEHNKIYPNNMPEIYADMSVYRNIDSVFEKQLDNAIIKRRIQVNIVVEDNIIKITDEDNNIVTTEINSKENANNQQKMNDNFIKQFSKSGESNFSVNKITLKQDIPFMPVSVINQMRRTLLDKLMSERLKNYKKEKQTEIKYTDFYKKEIDYRANVYNETAKEFYKNCNCTINEYAYEKNSIQNAELMRTKHCIKYALNMCKSPEKLFLLDEFNKKYQLEFDCKNCEMIIKK